MLRACFVFCLWCSIAVMFAPATASSLMRAIAGGPVSSVVDIYCNSTSAAACPPPSTAPATTDSPSTPTPQLLPALLAAAIVICVLLANLVHAFFFVRRNQIKIGSAKAWILACVMLGPLVWPMWWYRQRALPRANANTALVTLGWTESETPSSDPAPLPPAASAPPLEYSQRLNHNGLADSRMIVKPSAPPADDEAYAAVAQPVLPHAGGSAARAAAAAVAAAHQPAAGSLPLAPSLDQPSEDMMDQCPPPLPINTPSPLLYAHAAAMHALVLRVASAV